MATITTEQDVFGGVNQNDVASGDYAAIYNASEILIGVAKGSSANTNSFTITGSGGPTGKYKISAFVEGVPPSPTGWNGGTAVLKTGASTVATFGPGHIMGSVIQVLASGTYFWTITVGNSSTTEPSPGDPANPVYTGVPTGLKLFVAPV